MNARVRLRGSWLVFLLLVAPLVLAKQVAYIYGDIAADGSVPSGNEPAFHQMLLDDTGNRGCSEFRDLILNEGYGVTQHYDQAVTLNAGFLGQFDAIVFGLHQKIWSVAEKAALDEWINRGGGILMYSDSAAGGHYQQVGIKNETGQAAVNNVLNAYGMQVTVDQAGGTRAYTSVADACHPIVWDQPEFEGEGVSPVAVDETSGAEVLIPLSEAMKVSGGTLNIDSRNITIANPSWATLAGKSVGEGNVMAIFDRQPVWNNGEGSSIIERDNREVLRRIVKYLVGDYGNSDEWYRLRSAVREKPADGLNYLELSYRQWSGGTGASGVDYVGHRTRFVAEYSPSMLPGSWSSGAGVAEQVGSAVDLGDETEEVTVRILPADLSLPAVFARLRATCLGDEPEPLGVVAGADQFLGEAGTAHLNGMVTGDDVSSITWTKVSGPGIVNFGSASSEVTTASFSVPGRYELELSAVGGVGVASALLQVRVVAAVDVVRAINCGGSAYSGVNGFTYEADALFVGGHTDAFPGNAVANTADDALYNYARSGQSAYTVPLVDGEYTVLLQFAETFFAEGNKRVFSTSIEGNLVLDDLDIHVAAPGQWVAYDREFLVTVSGGQLDLEFLASVNNPLLNGFVVVRE